MNIIFKFKPNFTNEQIHHYFIKMSTTIGKLSNYNKLSFRKDSVLNIGNVHELLKVSYFFMDTL